MSVFPTKILLATEGSEEAELAARTATELAEKTGSELHVVYAQPITLLVGPRPDDPFLDIIGSYADAVIKDIKEKAQRLLDAQVVKVRAAGGTVAQAHLKIGGAVEEIVALAEEIGAGLIVLGSRGVGGVGRALMGSVSESVVRYAHCPVMVVRREAPLEEEEPDLDKKVLT
jgi:nucleotide-binding universal stress UspA family protein